MDRMHLKSRPENQLSAVDSQTRGVGPSRDSEDKETRTAVCDHIAEGRCDGRTVEGQSEVAEVNSVTVKTRKTTQCSAANPTRRHQQDRRFQEELQQLHRDLRLAPRTQAPPRKPYQPYLFNSLRPYYNISVLRFLSDPPFQIKGYSSRPTASGLTSPWVDFHMDNDPVNQGRNIHTPEKANTKRAAVSQASRISKEHRGRLPKFPVIKPETSTLSDKLQNCRDVPALRQEPREKSSHGARKFVTDYQQTRDHFYRSQLHRLDQVAPDRKQHICATYLAYLQNSPGSRRAINDCLRHLELLSSG